MGTSKHVLKYDTIAVLPLTGSKYKEQEDLLNTVSAAESFPPFPAFDVSARMWLNVRMKDGNFEVRS